MIDKNLVLVAARHTPTALKEPCVWQHQTAESVADLPQDERVFAGDLCVFAASDGTKTAFRYEHYWECEGEKKFDVYVPEVVAENGTVTFTVGGEELEELTYGDTVTVTVTADEGYQVKTITLNGEEIENNSEFTVEGDILLIAEFEEAPEPSGRVVFDGDILYTPKTDNTHRFVTTEISTQDETYNKIRVGFYDTNRTIASDGEQLSTKIIVAEDASTISLTIDGVDYGTHTLSTKMISEDDTEIQTSIVFDAEPAYVTGNGVLMSYGTFKDTGENYFVFIGYKPY